LNCFLTLKQLDEIVQAHTDVEAGTATGKLVVIT